MKKLIMALAAAAALVLAGCTTATPVIGTYVLPATPVNCEVLGRVKVTANSANVAYNMLMDKAIETYPNADDVLNIMEDKKVTKFLIFKSTTYTLSGIAVDYK